MWSPHYPPRPRYTVPRTAAHQSRDTRPAPTANLHTTWSSPGTSPVRVVTLSPVSAVSARASTSPVHPPRPSVLHARPRGEVEVPFEQKRYTPAAPADSVRAEQGLNELHAYEENHRIAGENFQRQLATSRAARSVLFADAEQADEVPAGSHGASPPTPPFPAEQMLHLSRRGGGAFSPAWAAAVPSSVAKASPLPGSPSPSRSLSSDPSSPVHQDLDAHIDATAQDSSRSSHHPVVAHTMFEAGLIDDTTLDASNATQSPTHFPQALRASISNSPHTLPRSTVASEPDLANASESVLEFFHKFADMQGQQFDRRRTGPGNTASPRAEKEHWAAKASCTDADAAQTQRVDGGFVTSFIPEFLQEDARDDAMQLAERTELPELYSQTVSFGVHSSITIFGVPRLSEHLTGYAIAAGEAEETDSDRAGASRYLEATTTSLGNELDEMIEQQERNAETKYAQGAAIQSAVDDMCVELVKIEAEELAAAAVEGKGEPASVGMMIGRMHDGAIIVNHVTPGGPAELAGVRSGQRLLAVEDVSVDGMRVAQIHELIKGPAGSPVVLSVACDLWGVSGMQREVARRTVIRAKFFGTAQGWLENAKGRLESDQRQNLSVFEKDHLVAKHVYRRACRQGRPASADRKNGLSDFPSGAAFDALIRSATLEKIETCGELACGEDDDVGWACCMSLRMETEDQLPQSESATINGIPQSHTFDDNGPAEVDDAHPDPCSFGGIADLQIDDEVQNQSSHTSRSGNSRQSPNEIENRVVSVTDKPEHAGQISSQIINTRETIKAAKDVNALTTGGRVPQDTLCEKAATAAAVTAPHKRSMPRVLYVASTPVSESNPPRGGPGPGLFDSVLDILKHRAPDALPRVGDGAWPGQDGARVRLDSRAVHGADAGMGPSVAPPPSFPKLSGTHWLANVPSH